MTKFTLLPQQRGRKGHNLLPAEPPPRQCCSQCSVDLSQGSMDWHQEPEKPWGVNKVVLKYTCLSPLPGLTLVQSQADHMLCPRWFLSSKSIYSTCWCFCTLTSVVGKTRTSCCAASHLNMQSGLLSDICLLLKTSSLVTKLTLFKLALSQGCQINSSRAPGPNLPLKICITWQGISVLLSLLYVAVMDSVWPARGSIWLKMLPSMALYHLAQWYSEGRIIGELTEFPWLGAYLNSLLVWMVSHCFLLFLILLKHRKRFWISFFSQAFKAAFNSSQKITFPACFESLYFLCEF